MRSPARTASPMRLTSSMFVSSPCRNRQFLFRTSPAS